VAHVRQQHQVVPTAKLRLEHVCPAGSGTADLFRDKDRFRSAKYPTNCDFVPDPADRKFAALAHATELPLVTSDAGLLNARSLAAFPILKHSEFAALREA